MLNRRLLLMVAAFGALAVHLGLAGKAIAAKKFAVTHTDKELGKLLTPDQYVVLVAAGAGEIALSLIMQQGTGEGLFRPRLAQ
ncbi:hypothetical protein ACC706_36100, partial [Rhizobium johnstonii]